MRLASLLVTLLLASCSDPKLVVDAGPPDAAPAPGNFTLTWSVTQGGQPVECAAVGASMVRVTAVPVAGGGGFQEIFDCDTGNGTSAFYEYGVYDVTYTLLFTDGSTVAGAPLDDFLLDSGTSEMPAVVFDVPLP
jgi:hypothetical protein